MCDTNKKFHLNGDLLNKLTNKNYNDDLASLSDKKLMYDSAKEMHFDICNYLEVQVTKAQEIVHLWNYQNHQV